MRVVLVVLLLTSLLVWAREALAQPAPPPGPMLAEQPTLAEQVEQLKRRMEQLERDLAARPPAPASVPAPALAAPLLDPSTAPYVDALGRTTPDQLVEGGDQQLKFLAYFFTKGEVNNIAPQNDLLQGRLVGRLFGNNTTGTGGVSTFAEQRLIPFIIFEPKILDGFARLRASFELNWTWGDSSYGVGGNFGAALSGRGVNLQTQNVHIEFKLRKNWFVTVGLQRLWDNPRDPYRTFFSTISLTGNRLAFWGTDAVGVSVWGFAKGQIFKFGVYDLYSNKINADDDVLLFEAMTLRDLGRAWSFGGHVRYLRDASNGNGGVSILGQGPNSQLADYNGVYRFNLGDARFQAHVVWLGADFSYNPELAAGRFGASAFVTGNFGRINAGPGTVPVREAADIDIAGVAANARFAYRYGKSRGSHLAAELMVTTGDSSSRDGSDRFFSGVMTGNTWGAPAAVFLSSGTYLLMPHSNVVNRLTTAVFDISNVGYGLVAGTLNLSLDLVRNLLTGKVGGAAASSMVGGPGGGAFIGVEANAALIYRPKVWFTIEAHAAYLKVGDFDLRATQAERSVARNDPWMALLAIKWLMF